MTYAYLSVTYATIGMAKVVEMCRSEVENRQSLFKIDAAIPKRWELANRMQLSTRHDCHVVREMSFTPLTAQIVSIIMENIDL
jgi:hypothetical protein